MTEHPREPTWIIARFNELTVERLHDVLMARQAVFVVEQQCIYNDVDALDRVAIHVLAYLRTELTAYARVLAPGSRFAQASFGRVLTTIPARGSGLGQTLVRQCIAVCEREFPDQSIQISAQCYLQDFYSKFGFVVSSEPYDEDGIAHVDMLLDPTVTAV